MAKKLSKFDKQATLRSVPRPRLPYLRCFLVISRIPKLLCNCTPCATMFRRRRHAAYSSKTLFHNNCALRPTSGTSSSLPWLQPSGPLGGREEYSRAGAPSRRQTWHKMWASFLEANRTSPFPPAPYLPLLLVASAASFLAMRAWCMPAPPASRWPAVPKMAFK